MPTNPKISVYLVCHNHEAYVEQAIESVLLQSYDNWELLIYNDSSSDRTGEIIDYYQGDERIRIVHTDVSGLVTVCNMAIEAAQGQYIIRLDGDDVFDENILLILGNAMDRDQNLALIFPDYYLIDESGEIFSHERRRKFYLNDHLMDMPPNGACTMLRTSVLN